jgi:transcriptional regulator with PAS, ATPase and Fis domain
MTADAEPRRNDSGQLDAFLDLLPALARGLDVRDFFRHLCAVASRVVPHDEARLVLFTDDRSRFHTYARTGDGAPEEVLDETTWDTLDANEPQLLDVVPGPERGLRSALSVPLRIDDRSVGFYALFSRRAHAYSTRDLLPAERFAAYLAVALSHERLAERARDAAVEQERLATLDCSVELLRAIADVLDIRSIFPRVSEIARKMLPHDALVLVFIDQNGEAVRTARSADIGEVTSPPPVHKMPLPDEILVDDLRTESDRRRLQALLVKDTGSVQQLEDAGYRAALAVYTRARDQAMALGFWSKRPRAFDRRDVPMARRIADHVALAVSHEQLAEAERQVAEARARAERLEARVRMLADELDVKTHGRVVGESPEWLDVLKKATQVAATETTVLVSGESGTGKEVVARFVHRASARKTGPFIAINCAALPEQLLESELFGYERGAFTGAQLAKPGQIELASGGVLFLDEVSEMSPSAQAKFLRVLQEREFQRLGGTRPLRANIRVVAATNRDLSKAVEHGDFREDLYYRLQVFEVHIPPLRERRADIVPLSEAFLQEIGKSFGRPPGGLTRDAREALLHHDWPGNVRELRNALERAAILCEGGLINAHHLALRAANKPSGTRTTDLNTLERETIAQVLRECRWNKSKAAQRLGLSRTQLYVRIRKYGLEPSASL